MIETREAIENLDSILDLEVRAIFGKANKNSKTSAKQRKARANIKTIIAKERKSIDKYLFCVQYCLSVFSFWFALY